MIHFKDPFDKTVHVHVQLYMINMKKFAWDSDFNAQTLSLPHFPCQPNFSKQCAVTLCYFLVTVFKFKSDLH